MGGRGTGFAPVGRPSRGAPDDKLVARQMSKALWRTALPDGLLGATPAASQARRSQDGAGVPHRHSAGALTSGGATRDHHEAARGRSRSVPASEGSAATGGGRRREGVSRTRGRGRRAGASSRRVPHPLSAAQVGIGRVVVVAKPDEEGGATVQRRRSTPRYHVPTRRRGGAAAARVA